MSITDLRYQDEPIDRFQRALAAGRLPHAYILAGPGGVGKSTTARELAKILLCEKPVKIQRSVNGKDQAWLDSCGTCTSCRLAVAGNHPDVHLVFKELIATVSGKEAHKATELGIDVIRQEVIDKVGFKPGLGRAKIFIVLEAHLLSRSAQNALLKTLEEPPENTYLFLVTEQLTAMLPTVRSRSQALVFKALPEAFVVEQLKAAGAEPGVAEFFARFAPGKVGTAMELFRLDVYDLKERMAKELAALEPASGADFGQWLLDQAEELAGKLIAEARSEDLKAQLSEFEMNRRALKILMALIGAFLRDALRVRLKFDDRDLVNADRVATVKALAANTDPETLRERIARLGEAEKWLDANVNVTLVVTNIVAKII